MPTNAPATPSASPNQTKPIDLSHLTSKLWQDRDEYIMFRIAKRVAALTEGLKAKDRAPLLMSMGAPTCKPPQILLDKTKALLDEPGLDTYSTSSGELFFRQAVAERMQKRFGVSIDPVKDVCSLVGSKEGLGNIFRGLITPNLDPAQQDIILTPDPGYASFKEAISGAGGYCYPIALKPEDDYKPNMDALWAQLMAEGIAPERIKAVIINYPNNPIGATAPRDYLEHVVAFARKHNILLISDLAYADLVFPGCPLPTSILEIEGAKDVAIEFHSLSKPYAMTGWRIGFAVGNPWAVQLLANVKSTLDSGIFKVLQKAGAFALTSPECDAYILEKNAEYAQNQAQMLEGFKQLGWPIEQMQIPQATFYLWLPVPPRYNTHAEPDVVFANEMLEKSGIVIVPGTAFGQYGAGYFRLSLVLDAARHQQVIDRMRQDGFTY
ncbi:MAG: aminotransferase class I/II-fold pyridoxal phosphate-dependent enzyme [Vampirovibrionales bacterium]|nr:aminotransferase class I/II-fold pyridoxal phosphate-dependent enzyme [Vampirovibrionales bacterium]